MAIYKFLVFMHVAIGVVALSSFWMGALSRKGSAWHKRVGKVYLLAMAGILLTGFPMSGYMYFYYSKIGAMFLLYLLIITGTAMWNSWRAIRDKRDVRAFKGGVFKFLMVLNGLSGLGVLMVGLLLAKEMQVIISAFSLIGILGARQAWMFLRQTEHEPQWWLREHIGGMMGNAVATHIAFFAIGLQRVLPMLKGPVMEVVAWLLPLVVATLAGTYLTRKYLRPRAVPMAQVLAVK